MNSFTRTSPCSSSREPDFGPPPPPPPYGFVAEEGDDWRDLPPPPPPIEVGVLPALIVAIPLIATARAYHDAGRRHGRAAPGAPPPFAHAPLPPPRLPGGVERDTAQPTRDASDDVEGDADADADADAGRDAFEGSEGYADADPTRRRPRRRRRRRPRRRRL